MTPGEWIANAIATVALSGAFIGWLSNRRDVKRAEALSERAAQAQERMALAMEEAEARRAASTPQPEPVWRLSHHTGDMYSLENIGTGPAHDVSVTPPNHAIFRERTPLPVARVRPGETVEFICARSMASGTDVTVTYADREGGEQHTWIRSLPPRPKR